LRIAQESLTNTIEHAKAKTFRATLKIATNEIQFRLEIWPFDLKF